jgi:cysteinyl-tRNA synthetase
LEKAKLGLERLYNALDYARLVEVTGIKTNSVREAKKKFSDALDNDFNTPRAIAVLFSLAKEINKLDKVGDDAVGFLEEALDVLGLKERTGLSEEARASILELIEELGGMAASTDDESLVKTIINLRNEYRRRGDYASSDRIRRKLGEVGVILEDTTQGTTWKFRL